MNSSQLLYKISTLEHSIGRKEFEYRNAVKDNDQENIALHKTAILQLKEELAATRTQFDTKQNDNTKEKPVVEEKAKKWYWFLKFKTAK